MRVSWLIGTTRQCSVFYCVFLTRCHYYRSNAFIVLKREILLVCCLATKKFSMEADEFIDLVHLFAIAMARRVHRLNELVDVAIDEREVYGARQEDRNGEKPLIERLEYIGLPAQTFPRLVGLECVRESQITTRQES